MNRIELPMNKDGFIRSNVSRASLFAVLTSEEYAGELNAVISRFALRVSGNEFIYGFESNFNEIIKDLSVIVDDKSGQIKISSHPYRENKYAYIYKKIISGEDLFVETKIDYIQDSNALTTIKLVLSDGLDYNKSGSLVNNIKNELSISINPKGKLIFNGVCLKKKITKKNIRVTEGIFLRLEINEYLNVKYSIDGINWVEVIRIEISELGTFCEAGIIVQPYINPFYYDFFLSHIQLCCTTDTMIIAPHFEAYERIFSRALQSMHVPLELLDITDKKVIDYFVKLIENKYYINIQINEYFIPGRSSYHKKNFIHVNFIYGVDKKRRVFKIMGFDMALKYDEIDFDNFFAAIQKEITPMSKINLYKYDSKGYPTYLNLPLVIRMLTAYLNGENVVAISNNKMVTIDENEPIMYGMQIYEKIITEETFMNVFCDDRRIIYQIHEHIEVIIRMLDFLHQIHKISDHSYNLLLKKYDKLNKNALIILNILLKSTLTHVDDLKAKIRNLLIKLKNYEKDALISLIDILQECEVNEFGC